MDTSCPVGALSYPGGILRFGPGQPILCVNDQSGYDCERPEVLAELQEGRFDRLIASAREGLAVGCRVYNIQLGTPALVDQERALVPAAVADIYQATGCCIAVDSRDPVTVDLALAAYPYKAMCNTVTGEWRNLETMLPIIARHGAAVGTALVYEKGIPQTVRERVAVARRIIEAAEACGIDRRDVMIDAVCLPGAVTPEGMGVTLETIKALHDELGVPVLLGISNAGFMMPNPRMLDLAYFAAAAAWGMDVAMIDPSTPLLAWIMPAMDFLTGADPAGKGYLNYYRAQRSAVGRRSAENARLHEFNAKETTQ
jgi:5-methyltetrahydrofolate--homocysteine methyltransferase